MCPQNLCFLNFNLGELEPGSSLLLGCTLVVQPYFVMLSQHMLWGTKKKLWQHLLLNAGFRAIICTRKFPCMKYKYYPICLLFLRPSKLNTLRLTSDCLEKCPLHWLQFPYLIPCQDSIAQNTRKGEVDICHMNKTFPEIQLIYLLCSFSPVLLTFSFIHVTHTATSAVVLRGSLVMTLAENHVSRTQSKI